ncbi:hypothetical protein NA56DRAFT_644652 [Hyaloscypha hepaticicola]|uniref:Uncharacterized protein n=1 Tax=Hyaloscypha hepaticicola TaxID=2082293 RepID=A0A2J6QA03_9HELO|nr:hypothetical protein NA56DRAFT_644652 [Hyaloscypha hepaticicola]
MSSRILSYVSSSRVILKLPLLMAKLLACVLQDESVEDLEDDRDACSTCEKVILGKFFGYFFFFLGFSGRLGA